MDDLEDTLRKLIAEDEIRFREAKEKLSNSFELAEVMRQFVGIADETESLLFLAAVRDKFGSFWSEDLYQSRAKASGEEPRQSDQYKEAHRSVKRLAGFMTGPGTPFTEGSCMIPGCVLPSTVRLVGDLLLCGAHHAMFRDLRQS